MYKKEIERKFKKKINLALLSILCFGKLNAIDFMNVYKSNF